MDLSKDSTPCLKLHCQASRICIVFKQSQYRRVVLELLMSHDVHNKRVVEFSLNENQHVAHVAPEHRPGPQKGNLIFQPVIFPGAYVSFREDGFSLPNCVVLQVSSHLKFSESNCNLAMVVKIRFWFKRTLKQTSRWDYVILVYLPTRDPLLSHFFCAN